MKRFFQRIGLITLICLSFIYTEKAANVLIEVDDLMVRIREEKELFKQAPVNAIVDGDTIIPGINGIEVDEVKSYHKIKKIGHYNKELLEYKTIKPNVTLSTNYNKYIIGGNESKRSVSLVFIVDKNTDVNKILAVLKQKNIIANFFIDSVWLENNNELLLSMIETGHNIGNLSYEQNYNHSDFIWVDTIIKKVGNQKQGYCYSEGENEVALKICALNKNFTIRPSFVVKEYPTLEVKENLKSGSIISLPINGVVEKELSSIIDLIYSKGLVIENLNKFLKE
ncbi:MAG: polysaccharide deacetylase family protein [Bacilli bacterium]|nr:polysaccharide deacetylase family protein [Bacilli bacterium]MDD4547502.1 polysaccharide deacetylase family protein [Bacilli bacterium]